MTTTEADRMKSAMAGATDDDIHVDSTWVVVSDGTNKYFGRPLDEEENTPAPGELLTPPMPPSEDDFIFTLSPVYHVLTQMSAGQGGKGNISQSLLPLEFMGDRRAELTILARSYIALASVDEVERRIWAARVLAAERMRTEIRAARSGLVTP
jgi:hypothetical protein